MLEESEPFVQGGLEVLHRVEQLLNLRLQFDDLLGGSMRGERHRECEEGYGGNKMAG
jgi:hypothetical protein